MRSVPVVTPRDRPPSVRVGSDTASGAQGNGRPPSDGDASWRDSIGVDGGTVVELVSGSLDSVKRGGQLIWAWLRWLGQVMLDTEHEEYRQRGYAPVRQSQLEQWRNKLIRAGVLAMAALFLFWLFCRLFGGTSRKRSSGTGGSSNGSGR